jgi:hypothetical protein
MTLPEIGHEFELASTVKNHATLPAILGEFVASKQAYPKNTF